MVEPIVFGGDDAEKWALQEAVDHSCMCVYTEGVKTATCSAHRLMTDQAALDHLVYVRRIADRLKAEEGLVPEGESSA